ATRRGAGTRNRWRSRRKGGRAYSGPYAWFSLAGATVSRRLRIRLSNQIPRRRNWCLSPDNDRILCRKRSRFSLHQCRTVYCCPASEPKKILPIDKWLKPINSRKSPGERSGPALSCLMIEMRDLVHPGALGSSNELDAEGIEREDLVHEQERSGGARRRDLRADRPGIRAAGANARRRSRRSRRALSGQESEGRETHGSCGANLGIDASRPGELQGAPRSRA